MRQLLLISLVAAVVAVGAVAYQLMPRGRAVPAAPAREQAAPASPVRAIPLRPRDAAPPSPVPTAEGGAPKGPDAPDDGSHTPEGLRTRDAAEGGGGATLTSAQVDALKAQAERRHVRPVTRMTFPLEPGTSVPPQVYLHPVPPELAGLGQAGDPLGFIQVGDAFALVGTVSRRIVAVSKG